MMFQRLAVLNEFLIHFQLTTGLLGCNLIISGGASLNRYLRGWVMGIGSYDCRGKSPMMYTT